MAASVNRLMKRDIKEVMCPFAAPDDRLEVRCTRFVGAIKVRCRNPREWESCVFSTANWEGL